MLTNMGVKAARKGERKCQEKQEFTVETEKIKICSFFLFVFFLQESFQYSLPLYEQSYDTAQGSSNSKLLTYCTR